MRDVVAGAVVGAIVAGATTAGALQVFSDVPDGHPFEEDITWMAVSGISEGYQDGTFRPSAPVTRQAMSAFMRRLAGADPEVDPMVDAASVGGLAAEDIGWHGTAVVTSAGALDRGTASNASKGSTGSYQVTFDRDVSACTFQVTVAEPDSTGFSSGYATAAGFSQSTATVFVKTFDTSGVVADQPFHLTVLC